MSADAAWEEQRCPTCGRFPVEVRPDCPPDCPSRTQGAGASSGSEESATTAESVTGAPAPAPSEPAPVNPDEQGQADPTPVDETQPGLVDRIESAVSGVIEGFRGDG